MLGDEAHAVEVLLEVALGEPLALGDHAEAVCARGLGGARVLEDLLGLHHRVHRRLGVGEARLRAEAAVLRAAAGLGVDQRAHVGRVGEALDARFPGALDQRFDLAWSSISPSCEGLLAGDQRRHDGRQPMRCGGRLRAGSKSRPAPARRDVSRRRRASPRACPARRTRPAQLDQLLLDIVGAARPRRAAARAITRLLPRCASGALPASSARDLERQRLELLGAPRRG